MFVLAVLVSLAAWYPRPIAEVANPYAPPAELVSTWVPVDVSLALIRYVGPWGFGLFWLLGMSLALIPLFDRGSERRPAKRPVVMALGLTFFVGYSLAWMVGHNIRSVSPSESVRREVLEERTAPAPPVEPIPRVQPADGSLPDAPSTTDGGERRP
jgi:quinol-cytochrome oxidoreductase complex cytochrome b subunit